jgi:hypothetical protein
MSETAQDVWMDPVAEIIVAAVQREKNGTGHHLPLNLLISLMTVSNF